MKKTIIVVCLTAILAGAGGFFGGMKYNQSKSASIATGAQRFLPQGQSANGQRTFTRNGNTNGQFATGQIVSKNDQSFTVQLRDGGSQIVFYNAITTVSKNTDGTAQDLTTGTNVMVTGTKNSDGSVTAKSIQIRPALPPSEQNQPPGQTGQN